MLYKKNRYDFLIQQNNKALFFTQGFNSRIVCLRMEQSNRSRQRQDQTLLYYGRGYGPGLRTVFSE